MASGSWSAAVSTASTASSGPAMISSTQVWAAPDKSKACRPCYIEVQDGWEYCTLCRHFATQSHLESEKHKYRVEMSEWEMQWQGSARADGSPADGPPSWWGNPTFFEWREGWRWWCRICNQWADGRHVKGARHLRKVAWVEWSAAEDDPFDNASSDGSNDLDPQARDEQRSPVLDPWGPDWQAIPNKSKWHQAWSEEYRRPYYYNTATEEQSWDMPPEGLASQARPLATSTNSVANAKATARPARASTHKTQSKPTPAAPREVCEVVPPPWSKEWSDEHQRHYYWNKVTHESQWDLPAWSDEWC